MSDQQQESPSSHSASFTSVQHKSKASAIIMNLNSTDHIALNFVVEDNILLTHEGPELNKDI